MPSLIEILFYVCLVCNVTPNQIVSKKRKPSTDLARGLYYYIANEYKYHPAIVGKQIDRSRAVCIIVTGRIRGNIQMRDKMVMPLYEAITAKIKEYVRK